MKIEKSAYVQNFPFVAVGCVVRKDNEFLLVREARMDKGLWNQPGGWLDKGENLVDGARREVKEETGLDVQIKGLLGVFNLVKRNHPEAKTDIHCVKIIFAAEVVGGELSFDKDEITEARWFSQEEIERMEKDELRDMDIKIEVKNFIEDKIFPFERLIYHTETEY